MIAFACKQCGRHHRRPDEAAGTLVFCPCGQGNRVPWTTTAPEAETGAEAPSPGPEQEERPRRRRRREVRQPDPAVCLNHADTPSQHTCPRCGEAFCAACVVNLEGRLLCGPCKNFYLRGLQRPVHPSSLAVVSLALGLLGGPLSLCVTVMSLGMDAEPPVLVGLGLGGLVLPGLAVVLAGVALRRIEVGPRIGGRGLAMTGLVTGIAGVVWSLALVFLVVVRMVQD